ncbi:MAG: NADP-dependent oxidoreductase, partial [Sandaracinobacter sp.]
MKTRQWLLADHPRGRPLKDEDFRLGETDLPEPGPGQALLQVLWLGFDPAPKGWAEKVAVSVAPRYCGDVVRGSGLARVVKSNTPKLKEGGLYAGMTCWTEWLVTDGAGFEPVQQGLPPPAM